MHHAILGFAEISTLTTTSHHLKLSEQLAHCDYEDEYMGPCNNYGTVYLLETEEMLCKFHFEKRTNEL